MVFWTSGNNAQDVTQVKISEVQTPVNIDNLLKEYDARVRPNYGGTPVKVGVTMYLLDISELDEKAMDFKMTFYFRQFWRDLRLGYAAKLPELTLGAETANKIWKPDTFFVNERKAYLHDSMVENMFMRILPDGNILMSTRYTLKLSCPMNFRNFPMDTQTCRFEIESYGHKMTDIFYDWEHGDKSVGLSPEIGIPHFQLMGLRQKKIVATLTTGNYSRLLCELKFSRKIGNYLFHMYFPSSAIVLLSWISFWMSPNAVIARLGLGAVCMLTLTVLMSNINVQLPTTSYVKSIDAFLGTCFIMVFAALLEFAIMNYFDRKSQGEKRTIADDEDPQIENKVKSSEHTAIMDAESRGLKMTIKNYIYRMQPSSIDKYSRVVFPLFFISFNLLYWIISMNNWS